MKIKILRNFKFNGVKGISGQIIEGESPLFDDLEILKAEGLIEILENDSDDEVIEESVNDSFDQEKPKKKGKKK